MDRFVSLAETSLQCIPGDWNGISEDNVRGNFNSFADFARFCRPSWYQMVLPSFSQLLRRWDEQNDDASQNWAADASR